MPKLTIIQDEIRARLAEVEQQREALRLEAEQLTKLASCETAPTRARPRAAAPTRAHAKTAATASSRTARPAPSAAATERRRQVASTTRAQQAVAKIVEQPGITPNELAHALGIKANYLYRVLPRLEREARVVKQGKGYHPAENAHTSAPVNAEAVAA
jgi:hypothetical protein